MQTTQPPNAPQCKPMQPPVQREEWISTLLVETTINPKISNNELAEKYGVHRNRISKYRNLLRQRQRVSNYETLNKIDSILEDRLLDMEDRDLIALRRQLIPEQLEVKQEIKQIKLEWQLESNTPNPVQTSPQTTGVSPQQSPIQNP